MMVDVNKVMNDYSAKHQKALAIDDEVLSLQAQRLNHSENLLFWCQQTPDDFEGISGLIQLLTDVNNQLQLLEC